MKDEDLLKSSPCGCGNIQTHMEHGMRIVKDHAGECCGESLLMALEFAKLTTMKMISDNLVARNKLSPMATAVRVAQSSNEIEQLAIGVSIVEIDHFNATYKLMFAEPTSEHMQ